MGIYNKEITSLYLNESNIDYLKDVAPVIYNEAMSINNIAVQILAEMTYNEVIIEASLNENFEYVTEGNFTDKIKRGFEVIINFLKTCWKKFKDSLKRFLILLPVKRKKKEIKQKKKKVTEEAAKKAATKKSSGGETNSNNSSNDNKEDNKPSSSNNNKSSSNDTKSLLYNIDNLKKDIKSTMKKNINITEVFKDYIHYEDEKYNFKLNVCENEIYYMFKQLYGSGSKNEKIDDFKALSSGKMNQHKGYFSGDQKPEDISEWINNSLQISMKDMFSGSSFKELYNKISSMTSRGKIADEIKNIESYIKKSDIKFSDVMSILNKPFGLNIEEFKRQYNNQKEYINNSLKIVERVRKQCEDWAKGKFDKYELRHGDTGERSKLTYQAKMYSKGVESIGKLSEYLNSMMNIINALNSSLSQIYTNQESQRNRLRSWYTNILVDIAIKNATLESTLDLDNRFELL